MPTYIFGSKKREFVPQFSYNNKENADRRREVFMQGENAIIHGLNQVNLFLKLQNLV